MGGTVVNDSANMYTLHMRTSGTIDAASLRPTEMASSVRYLQQVGAVTVVVGALAVPAYGQGFDIRSWFSTPS